MYKSIDELVERIDERNSDGKISTLIGVSIDKCFINSVANINGTDLTKYKIIRRDDFAVSLMQVSRDSKIPIARLKDYDQAIMSPAYPIFRVRDTSVILPEYLEMWFMRPEFDREAAFIAVGGVRGSMPWEEFAKMRLPVPSLEKQHQVVRAYQIVADRIAIKRRINDNLDSTMQAIYKNYFVDFTPFKSEPTCATKLGEIPASWSVCKFCDLCDLLNGRAYSQEELLDSGKYRVLRVGNFFTKNSWYYSDMELEDNKYCYPDDLLFCWSASFGLYIWNDVKTIYHYHIWKIDFSKTAPYYREYIFLYLKQELNKLSKEGHGSVMAHLTKSGVENLDIVSPPEEIIKQFHNSIIPFIEHKKLVEKEVQQLTELRESILSKMVS
ncbi:restriction endonuclease subunit S [Gemmiger formicilis]|jgi:restriction endonuclease S subunit|uniref:restriction endonuclease subunit S n=1 Tax=Gemmiger formicilis TaxID=745368 RepID=UPI003521A389